MVDNETFVPRKGLKRQLQYRSLFDVVYYGIIVALFVTVWLMWAAYLRGGMDATFEIGIYAFIGALLLINFVPLRLPRKWRKATFRVEAESLVIDNQGQEVVIPYADIQKMKFFYSLSPSFSLTTAQGVFHVSMFLERSEYVIEAVMSSNPNASSMKEARKYRAVAVSQDHQFAFLRDVLPIWKKDFPKLIIFAAAIVVLSAVFSGFQMSFVSVRNLVWEIFYAVLSLVLLYVMTFGIIMNKVGQKSFKAIEENPQNLIRDTAYGQTLIGKSRKWVWFFGILLCVFYASTVYIKHQI